MAGNGESFCEWLLPVRSVIQDEFDVMPRLHELADAENSAGRAHENEMDTLGTHLILNVVDDVARSLNNLFQVFFALNALSACRVERQSKPGQTSIRHSTG